MTTRDISDLINELPQRLRDYVHHLETDADPSGTLRENFRLREENGMLRLECKRAYMALDLISQEPESDARNIARQALDDGEPLETKP